MSEELNETQKEHIARMKATRSGRQDMDLALVLGMESMITSLRARVERMEKGVEAWQGMENAPKDGSTFLIRYPKQGNTLDLCYWVKVHNQWRSRGVLVFPDIQGCEWFPLSRITALAPEKAKTEGEVQR